MRRVGGLLAALLLVAPLGAHAAGLTNQNITVSPTQLPLSIAAGGTTSGRLTVINDGDLSYDFRTYTAAYNVTGEDYAQSFELSPGQLDVPSWIHLPTTVMHLEAHQSTVVPYTITVPRGVASGGYYATLFVETAAAATTQVSGVQHKERIGVVAYLSIPGNITSHGTVESFTAAFLQQGKPLTTNLRLGNQGNDYYQADVHVTAADLFGRRKADIHVVRQVLPSTIRHFAINWPSAPPLGLFKVGGTAAFLGATHVLPSHYVLVVSEAAFIWLLGGLVVVIAALVWWWRGRRRSRH